jgi:hypothetical protein
MAPVAPVTNTFMKDSSGVAADPRRTIAADRGRRTGDLAGRPLGRRTSIFNKRRITLA